MAKKPVDIAAMLGKQFADVPKLDTSGREQIQYINIDLIDDDPNNFYELSGIDELASNIELCGLQQPIRVRAGEDRRYIIVSGHRRRASLRKLVEGGRTEYQEAPCIVEQADGVSAAMQELCLIYANADTRQLTSAEQSKQAERVEALLYQLKEEGTEFPGRMRDHVAEACKLSKSKLARLKVIRNKLIPLWATLYKKDEISEDFAYEMAKLSEDYQRKLYDANQAGLSLYGNNIDSWGRQLASLDAIVCPKGEQCCTNADNMWQRMLKKNDWCSKNCDGRYGKATCCKGCSELYSCKFACEQFAKQIAKHKAETKIQKKTEREEQQAKEQAHIAQVAASWARFAEARKAAKIKMNDLIRGIYAPDKPQYAASYSDWREKEWANREKGEGITSNDRPFGADILNNNELVRAADILGCSLDYLLGRVDDPTPFTGAWKNAREETPDEGQFLFVCDTAGCVQPSVYWHGAYMDATPKSVANKRLEHILSWMYQPALPGGMKHNGQCILEELMQKEEQAE